MAQTRIAAEGVWNVASFPEENLESRTGSSAPESFPCFRLRLSHLFDDDSRTFDGEDLYANAGRDKAAVGDHVDEFVAEANHPGGPQRRVGGSNGAQQRGR